MDDGHSPTVAGLKRLLDLQPDTHAEGKQFVVSATPSQRNGFLLVLLALPKDQFRAIDLAKIFDSDLWEEERLAALQPGKDFALVGPPGWGPEEYRELQGEVVAALAG